MGKELAGKVALVTGAGSGIGAEIARLASNEGASVALVGRNTIRLEGVATQLVGETLCVPCDVQSESAVNDAVSKVVAQFGQLDILVNNAGAYDLKSIEETSIDLFDQILNTNLRGAFTMSKAAWPHLRASKGQVLNLSSIAGTQGFANCAAYCASKFGMNGLSAALALEGNPLGIRVLTVCPAAIDTDLWGANAEPEERNRMMKPEQVAEACLWALTRPRQIRVAPIVIDNFTSPFVG